MQLKKAFMKAVSALRPSRSRRASAVRDGISDGINAGAFPMPAELGPYMKAAGTRLQAHSQQQRTRKKRSDDADEDCDEILPGPYHAYLLGLDAADVQLVRRVAIEQLTAAINDKRNASMGHGGNILARLVSREVGPATEADVARLFEGELSMEQLLNIPVKRASLASPQPKPFQPTERQRQGIFGCPLADLPQEVCNQDCGLPRAIVRLMAVIWDQSRTERGLFRIEGSHEVVSRVASSMAAGFESDPAWVYSGSSTAGGVGVHERCSLFKKYLRDLPGLLVPRAYAAALYALRHIPDARERARMTRLLLLCLPPDKMRALSAVVLFLRGIALESTASGGSGGSGMTATNLAIVFMPSLIDVPADLSQIGWMTGVLGDLVSGGEEDVFSVSAEYVRQCLLRFSEQRGAGPGPA